MVGSHDFTDFITCANSSDLYAISAYGSSGNLAWHGSNRRISTYISNECCTSSPTTVSTTNPVTPAPTSNPTAKPTQEPTTTDPTSMPTAIPTADPITPRPTTSSPSASPSIDPTMQPLTDSPTIAHQTTDLTTMRPINDPSSSPTSNSTTVPTADPTNQTSVASTNPACLNDDLYNLNVAFIIDVSCGLSATECFSQSQTLSSLIASIKPGPDPAVAVIDYFDPSAGGAGYYVCPNYLR